MVFCLLCGIFAYKSSIRGEEPVVLERFSYPGYHHVARRFEGESGDLAPFDPNLFDHPAENMLAIITVYLVGRQTQEYQPVKYLGLPGVPKPLYGLEAAQKHREVFIAEGAFDILTLLQWGYPAVALLGSHLERERFLGVKEPRLPVEFSGRITFRFQRIVYVAAGTGG